jgi:hypothetical protein
MLCWTIFGVMCALFGPALLLTLHSPLLIVPVIVVWWGPFVYGMYIAMAVYRNGDRRLLKRGIKGTAAVLSAKATNEVIQAGEFDWEAPRVYKYGLLVNVPGREPYKTTVRICASSIREGQTVHVAVAPHNHKRVTIDVGQGQKGGARRPVLLPVPSPVTHLSGYAASGVDRMPATNESERLSELAQLGRLHAQGVLTDAEFATQKARILNG